MLKTMEIGKDIASYAKKLFLILIIGVSVQLSYAIPDKTKEAEEKKQEHLKTDHEEALKKMHARLERHFKMQTKDVKKRMKINQELTDSYYNKKLGDSWFLDLFKRNRQSSLLTKINLFFFRVQNGQEKR